VDTLVTCQRVQKLEHTIVKTTAHSSYWWQRRGHQNSDVFGFTCQKRGSQSLLSWKRLLALSVDARDKSGAPKNNDVFYLSKVWESEFAIVKTTAHSFCWHLGQRWGTKNNDVSICQKCGSQSLLLWKRLLALSVDTWDKSKSAKWWNFLSKNVIIRADYRENDCLLFLVTILGQM
jgi:hypothetical protein